MIPYRFTVDGEYDLNMFANRYDSRSKGLGDRFIDDVQNAIGRIQNFPESGEPVGGTEYRRMILDVFEHSV